MHVVHWHASRVINLMPVDAVHFRPNTAVGRVGNLPVVGLQVPRASTAAAVASAHPTVAVGRSKRVRTR
jgi:hypothetical protein